jgi:hypothetical protein
MVAALSPGLIACDDQDNGSDLDALRALVQLAGDIDYEPLRSPVDAVQQADVIVLGEVIGASLATQASDASSSRETRYIILTVAVRTVLSGVLSEPGGTVAYVALRAAGIDPAVEIEEAVPKVRTLLVLDDRTAELTGNLEGFPEQFYEPFTDGAWFETGDTFEGLWVERGELEQRWEESIESLDDLAQLIELAASQ